MCSFIRNRFHNSFETPVFSYTQTVNQTALTQPS